jgi:hypothetical protein
VVPKQLVRFGKRRTSWDEPDLTTIMQVEFRTKDGSWDLQPSVYEIKAATEKELRGLLIRVYTEHSASLLQRPPRGIPPIDTSDAQDDPPLESTGTTFFTFANSCHRELVLASEEQLRALVKMLRDELGKRRLAEVKAQEMLEYASQRLNQADAEWTAFVANHQNGPRWLKLIQKHDR